MYTMEHIRTAKVENVKLLDKVTPKSSPIGTLYLTTSHLIFIDEKEKKELRDEWEEEMKLKLQSFDKDKQVIFKS